MIKNVVITGMALFVNTCTAAMPIKMMTISYFLTKTGQANTVILGSSCAFLPALAASALIEKVSRIMEKHGHPNSMGFKARSLQNKMLIAIEQDRNYSTQIIHGNSDLKLKNKENQTLRLMESLAARTYALAIKTWEQSKKIHRHREWYKQDLEVAKRLSHSSMESLKLYQ